jgi:hypothetical protein
MRSWAVAAALALAGCGGPVGQKGRTLDAVVEKLIPPDTVVLGGVNVQRVLKSPVYARLSADEKEPAAMREFARATGLDLKRDLSEVYFASAGKEGMVIARASIADPAALEKTLESKGAQRIPAGRYNLFGRDGKAVVFLDGKLAVAGPVDMLRAALAGQGGDSTKKQAVLYHANSIPAGADVWAVTVGGFAPMPLPETGNLANLNRIFGSLESATMTLDLSSGAKLAAAGVCTGDKAAKQLHDTLRGLIGFGRLSTPADKPEMLRLFDGIEVAMAGAKVNVNADVPLDMVDYFLKPRVLTRGR